MLRPDHLRRKIEEVCHHFPWYRTLIGKNDPATITELSHLPLLTPELMEKHYYHERWEDHRTVNVYHTSGTSSGRRKAIAYSAEDEKHYVNIKAKLFSQLLTNSGCTKAFADMGTGHAAATAKEVFEQIGLTTKTISFALPIAQHIEQLHQFQPDILYTMPSILDRIASAANDPQMFGIRKIILVGEIASMEWQHRMANRFGLRPQDIIDTYGSIEIGTIAYYNHDVKRYVFVDGLFAEGVNPHEIYKTDDYLRSNECVLVLNSFVRTMFPALRFVTNDVVRDLQPIHINGEPKQSFQSIVKRIGNEIKHGEKISLYDIEEAVHKHIHDALIRVEADDNKLKVRIKSETATNKDLTLVQKEIEACIPEIGQMIRGGLLQQIEVSLSTDNKDWKESGIKQKRIFYKHKG